jgi:hypothetical protein
MEFTQKKYERIYKHDWYFFTFYAYRWSSSIERREESRIYRYKIKNKSKKISSTRNWYLSGFANLAIANNTVSHCNQPIAKEINDEYDLNPRKQF